MTASVNMTRNIFSGLKQSSFPAASTLMRSHFKRLDFSKVSVRSFANIQKLHVLGPLLLLKCQDCENDVEGCAIWHNY